MYMFFRSIKWLTNSSLGSGGRCELTRMTVQYDNTVNKIPAYHRDEFWVEKEIVVSRSENEEFIGVALRMCRTAHLI